MPKQLALVACLALIFWLFHREKKMRPMPSPGLWIAFIWLSILFSRPISSWLNTGLRIESPDDYLDGSPLDRNIFLFLIILAWITLAKRHLNWKTLLRTNCWVVLFFLYCGLSCLWSDYPFVSLKRWVKDVGNLLMVLIIITEKDPVRAVIAVFSRCAYWALPLSIVLIKYFPDQGRYLSSSWENTCSGVAVEKNSLGCLAFLSGMFLIWDLMQMRRSGQKTGWVDVGVRRVLFLMVCWLLYKANSSTALVCLLLGAAVLLVMRAQVVRSQVRYLGTYCVAAAVVVALLYSVPAILGTFLELLGEDVTLTGRTELWAELMRENINPALGAGYQSFWLGSRAESYWEKWEFHPNQAHNGWLETYLQGGLIGLVLLLALIAVLPGKLKAGLSRADSYAIFRFSLFTVILFYNWTEAMFNKLSPIWFFLLVVAVEYPRRRLRVRLERLRDPVAEDLKARTVPQAVVGGRRPELATEPA